MQANESLFISFVLLYNTGEFHLYIHLVYQTVQWQSLGHVISSSPNTGPQTQACAQYMSLDEAMVEKTT